VTDDVFQTPILHYAEDDLVGGFNPFEKYESNWIISPGRDENKTYLKPPPSDSFPTNDQNLQNIHNTTEFVVTENPSPGAN